MQRWLAKCRACLCLMALAACLALTQLLDPATTRDWLYPGLLTVLAIGMAGTKLRFPQVRGSLAVSDLFGFGVVISVPLFVAPAVASLIAVVSSRLEPARRSPSGGRSPLRILATVLIAAFVAGTHPWLISQVGDWTAVTVAAVAYLWLSALGGSLTELTVYRGRLLWARTLSSLALGALFTPAALFVARASELLSFSSQASPLWAAGSLIVVLYLVLEMRWGPVYADTLRRNEMEALYLRAVEALALAVEAKDSVSGTHLKRRPVLQRRNRQSFQLQRVRDSRTRVRRLAPRHWKNRRSRGASQQAQPPLPTRVQPSCKPC